VNSPADNELKVVTAPYRGIEPYRLADRAIFFARESETRKLLRSVTIYRGVLLYGDSGVGKSSLINAGLIPALLDEDFVPDRVRVQPRVGEEFIVERTGGIWMAENDWSASTFLDKKSMEPRAFSAAQFLHTLRRAPANRYPLLIFDQFEELATLFEEAPREKPAIAAQQTILGLVVDLLRDPNLPVKILFAFREDYLAKLTKLFVLSPDLQDRYLRLTPPKASLLHKIIRGPFERPELKRHFGRELSEKLTDALIPEFLKRTEVDAINLTEVQIVCSQLWQSERPERLFKQRGIQGLLEDYTTNVIDKLAMDNLKWPAIALLKRLVTPSGTRNIVSKDELIDRVHREEDFERDTLEHTLQALETKTRLITQERRHGSPFYEIVSEFLVPWILQQKTERQRPTWQEFESLPSNLGADQHQLAILRTGVDQWNRWRKSKQTMRPALQGVNFNGADLTGADLSNSDLSGASMVGANLSAAQLTNADLRDANLSHSSLKGALLKNADLKRADLSRALLEAADLTGADLSYVRLIGANLRDANIEHCRVYGIAAWDLNLTVSTRQSNLIITPPGDPPVTVDNLEVANLIYLLLSSANVRGVIDTMTSRAVLVMGRFSEKRKPVLDAIRDELRKYNYLPIVFDFPSLTSQTTIETIRTLASMARFIIADITDARSVIQELYAIVPGLPSVAVRLLIKKSDHEYGMLDHLRMYPWVVTGAYEYENDKELIASIQENIIGPAEAKVRELAAK
jgi:uncharacterized protein YjbI with pentapeptide repeats